ncbi:GNAT family N-acetyltransferase [Microbacteriaceae bacterium 4G12]
MLTFELVTEETLPIVKEMVHSNPGYRTGKSNTDNELKQEYLHNLPKRFTYFIKADDTYIGLLDYVQNDRDVHLNQLMVHGDYQGYGYGTNAYYTFEEQMKQQGVSYLRVLPNTEKAKHFWESLGFTFLAKQPLEEEILVDYYEKQLI